jgi:simple sugar transport system permease protein
MAREPELAKADRSLVEPAEPEAIVPGRGPGSKVASALRAFLRKPESGAIIGTVVLFVVFSVWAPNFLSLPSIASILTIAAELGVVAMGVTLLMIGGEFDLSVGSVLGISSVLVPWLMLKGVAIPFAILAALGAAILIGLLNGIIVTKGRIQSFIVTLGGLFWWRGVLFAVTQGFPLPVDTTEPWLQPFSARFTHGFYAVIFWFVGLAIVLSIVLLRTRFGNWIFATGGNVRAAEQRGIPVQRVKIILFMTTAFLAGLTGIMQMGRFSSVDSLRGTLFELEAVAAAVIGGSLLSGGYGSVLGTALGCIMLGMIRTGLVLAGVPGYWYRAFVGLLIVLVVIVNTRGGRVSPPR